MPEQLTEIQEIYVNKIIESVARFRAALRFHESYTKSKQPPELDAAILQARKGLELIAMAAIAPNKEKYAEYRAQVSNDSQKSGDYTKDFNAKRIFQSLSAINPNFYPLPLVVAPTDADGMHHFGQRISGFLTQENFTAFYDRLGKYLHADNPWGNNKNVHQLANELPEKIELALSLLDLHATFIITPEFNGIWLLQVPRDGTLPLFVTGQAEGEFTVQRAA